MNYMSGITSTPFNPSELTPEEGEIQMAAKGAGSLFVSGACYPLSTTLAAIIFGIGIGILATTLVMKGMDAYNPSKMTEIRRYFSHEDYLKFAAITLVAALAIGLFSPTIGGSMSFLVGTYGALNQRGSQAVQDDK